MSKKRPGLFTIALGLLLLAFSACHLLSSPAMDQYAVLAPRLEQEQDEAGKTVLSNQPLQSAIAGLDGLEADLRGVVDRLSLAGTRPGTDFISDEALKLSGTLTAVGGDYCNLYGLRLKSGRLFYPEELKWGAKVALIDETVALKLFRTAEPLGRTVKIGDTEYRIVGVVHKPQRLGTVYEANCFVPIRQVAREPLQLETLTLSARPVPGAGATAAFAEAAGQWLAGGDCAFLAKEVMRALMPLRILIFCACLYALSFCARRLRHWAAVQCAAFRERLRTQYLKALLLPYLWRLLALTAAVAALAAGIFAAIAYLVEPVYTFPEYVPKVLVEWREIAKTFWDVQAAQSNALALRTPELLRIRFYGGPVLAGCALIVAGLLRRLLRAAEAKKFPA